MKFKTSLNLDLQDFLLGLSSPNQKTREDKFAEIFKLPWTVRADKNFLRAFHSFVEATCYGPLGSHSGFDTDWVVSSLTPPLFTSPTHRGEDVRSSDFAKDSLLSPLFWAGYNYKVEVAVKARKLVMSFTLLRDDRHVDAEPTRICLKWNSFKRMQDGVFMVWGKPWIEWYHTAKLDFVFDSRALLALVLSNGFNRGIRQCGSLSPSESTLEKVKVKRMTLIDVDECKRDPVPLAFMVTHMLPTAEKQVFPSFSKFDDLNCKVDFLPYKGSFTLLRESDRNRPVFPAKDFGINMALVKWPDAFQVNPGKFRRFQPCYHESIARLTFELKNVVVTENSVDYKTHTKEVRFVKDVMPVGDVYDFVVYAREVRNA